MSLHLIVQYYNDANPERQVENDYCLEQNAMNFYISKIHLLIESKTTLPSWVASRKKMIVSSTGNHRLTFQKAVDYVDHCDIIQKGDIVVIVNSDIILDQNSKWNEIFKDFSTNPGKIAMTLTRHELNKEGDIWKDQKIYQGGCQDAWIFQKLTETLVPLEMKSKMNFCVGSCLGCDGYMCYLMKNFGLFHVLNMSEKYKTLHYDRVRGHSNGECLTTSQTDYSLKYIYSDAFIMLSAFVCPYVDYNSYINSSDKLKKYPLNFISTCYSETPHVHLDDVNDPKVLAKKLTFDNQQFILDAKQRVLAVGRKSITKKERFKTWLVLANALKFFNLFIDIFEWESDTCLKIFPDAAFMYYQEGYKHLYETKNYPLALSMFEKSLQAQYNENLSKQKSYYEEMKPQIMDHIAQIKMILDSKN